MKNKVILTTLCFLVAGAVLYWMSDGTPAVVDASAEQEVATARIADLMCPEDYQTTDERAAAFASFAENYVIVNPEAYGNDSAFTVGRADFLISHYCTDTLMNFGYDGVSPIDANIRQELITAMNVDAGSDTSALPQTGQTTPKQANTISNTPTSTPTQIPPAQAQSSGGGGSGAYSSGSHPVTPLKCSDYTSYFASIPNCEFLGRNSSVNADGVVIEHPLYKLCKQCLSASTSTPE